MVITGKLVGLTPLRFAIYKLQNCMLLVLFYVEYNCFVFIQVEVASLSGTVVDISGQQRLFFLSLYLLKWNVTIAIRDNDGCLSVGLIFWCTATAFLVLLFLGNKNVLQFSIIPIHKYTSLHMTMK